MKFNLSLKCLAFILLFTTAINKSLFSQLKDIKIIIPKEIGYSQGDFAQFFDKEKYFATCGNAVSVFNTETGEMVDEYDLQFGAKNLSISPDEKLILVTVNNNIMVFSFEYQRLTLLSKISTADVLNGIQGAEYYKDIPISSAFFINKGHQIYACAGSFSVIYDIDSKSLVNSYNYELGTYLYAACFNKKKNEIIVSISKEGKNGLYKQPLEDFSKIEKIMQQPAQAYKLKLCDSLLMCFDIDKYFVFNIESGKVEHEITLPISSVSMGVDEKTKAIMNKRTPIGTPDKVNFKEDEYILDMDYLRDEGVIVYATSKEMKFYNPKTKKITKKFKGINNNIKVSPSNSRLVTNGYLFYKSLRIYNPQDMSLIAERSTMGNPIYSTNMSPNKKWLYTNGSHSGFIWNMNNFTKHAEIKDISGKDSSFIMSVQFLNDSELIVNSGLSINNLNLFIYNFYQKKVVKILKKNIYAVTAGFNNGEFYYADYGNLYILNLKTGAEEKYPGLFSLAAVPSYRIVSFTNDLVFIPGSGKFSVVNRKTKKTVYESETWAVTSRVFFSDDGNSLFTSAQITKKRSINGYEVDMPTNAIVKINLQTGKVDADYAATIYPYDFHLKDNGKTIGMWYVKYDIEHYNANENKTMYSEYDVATGNEKLSKELATTPSIVPFHFTSDSGKYFGLAGMYDGFFKIYNEQGEEVIDLKDMNLYTPRCFFVEDKDLLIITSSFNSMATFVDLKKRKVLGQLANAEGDQFFLITSDLHYLGAKEFVKNIRFKYKDEVYGFEQFDAYLNQPHQVLRTFECSDSALIQAYEKAYNKRLKLLGIKPDTKINFSSLPTFQFVKMREDKPGTPTFSISANKGANKLTSVKVFNNGSLILTEPIPDNGSVHFEKSYSFETSSGINRFEFTTIDELGLESPHITRFYNNTNIVKPNLYLAVIASEKFKNTDFDLAYAVKDASDMANTMANSKSFEKIYTKKVFNKSFATDSLQELKKFFAPAGVNDVVMVFFAGHGFLDTDFSYYFPTYYTDFSDPKVNSVSYTSFEKLLKEVKPLRKLMFIDACFSGEVDKDETYFDNGEDNGSEDTTRAISTGSAAFAESTALEMSKTVFSDLRESSGATIISSAGGTEAALEGERWNNGLFTHCVLEGLTKLQADFNSDGKITLTELQKYVAEQVYELSEGKQMPTYRVENTVLDYELW